MTFFEPPTERLTRDAEDAGDATHGRALLVSGQHLCLEDLGVRGAAGVLAEGAPAVMAAVALHVLDAPVADDVLALAVTTKHDVDNHTTEFNTTTRI